MEQVTKAKAKQLFEAGRVIYVRPSGVKEQDVFSHLSILKSKFTPRFPEPKISYYEESYSARFGKGVVFLIKPLPVRAQWTGNGYRLQATDESLEYRVNGKEGRLVKFVKAHLLEVTNSGIFAPVWRLKLQN